MVGSVPLEESMWDAALLLGVQDQGMACIVWSGIILLLNMGIQTTLTYVISFTEMTAPAIGDTTVAEFRRACHPNHLSVHVFSRDILFQDLACWYRSACEEH